MRKRTLQELNRLSVSEFRKMEKAPMVVVLDHIRSALNVGSAFRTADAFALQGLHLCGITAQPPHREILKTAIGATESVDWKYWQHTRDALLWLKAEGYTLVGVEQTDQSVPLQAFHPPTAQPLALVFGNEVQGLSDDILPLLDVCLEIPQYGTKHSLNVSVCVGIVCWEMMRQRMENNSE